MSAFCLLTLFCFCTNVFTVESRKSCPLVSHAALEVIKVDWGKMFDLFNIILINREHFILTRRKF